MFALMDCGVRYCSIIRLKMPILAMQLVAKWVAQSSETVSNANCGHFLVPKAANYARGGTSWVLPQRLLSHRGTKLVPWWIA